MDSQWESRLREKMAGYSEPEPPGLWNRILEETGMDVARKERKSSGRRFLIPAFIIPAAAAAIAAFFIFRSDFSTNTPDTTAWNKVPEPAGEQIIGIVPENAQDTGMEESTVEGHESLIADAAPLSGPSGKNGQPQQGSQQDITEDEARDKAPGNTGDTGDTAEMHGTGQTGGSATEETDKMNGSGTDSRPVRKPQEEYREDFWNDTDFRKDRSRKRRMSADVFISNLTGSAHSYNGFGTYQPQSASFKGIPATNAVSGTPGTGVLLITQEKMSNTEIKHRQPIRAGLNFRYNITERWGLETGLVYSYLSSSMTSENGSRYSTNTEQVLHYLGIPLKASYDIFSRRHFTIYASAGGMVEKCIKGKVSTKSRFNESDTGPLQDKVTIRQLQWSVSAEAGVQWNIIPMLGVYIEPGVSWYFDNGSMVSTIYKEKPLNFNLEFGLRFSFE